MRLGGPVMHRVESAQEWVIWLNTEGYRAAYCPLTAESDDSEVKAYSTAAFTADIVIAEVGAWSNPLSPDISESKNAINHCIDQLDLAEGIGARCCVNISGSCSDQWDGPHPDNLTQPTFDRIVENTRLIIDAVKPKRTSFSLDTMPWSYPNSVECYVDLIRAIDRPQFAVHLDPVNLINSPSKYYKNADLMREAFQKLGPYIRSCHAKDIRLSGKMTVHLEEVRPGLGELDYSVFLKELKNLIETLRSCWNIYQVRKIIVWQRSSYEVSGQHSTEFECRSVKLQ